MRDGNWIDGAWRSSEGGDSFEVHLRGKGGAGREWWPRSTPDDFVQAFEGLARGASPWRQLDRPGRARALAEVLDRWQDDPAGLDAIAAQLGFGEGQLDDHLEAALVAGDRCLATGSERGEADDPRPLLVRAPAGEFLAGLVRASLPGLLDGRAVLFLSDPDLPDLAREFLQQLVGDERLAGAVSLLHEDRSTCLALALSSDAFARAHAPGARRLGLSVPRGAPSLPALSPGGSGFGGGVFDVERRRATAVDDAPLSNSALAVLHGDDPVEAAARVVRLAFDPLVSLSGQLEGQVGRVACHERHLSRFTQALLAELERLGESPSCPLFTFGLRQHCGELRRLGLDEGATLIEDGLDPPTGFRGGSREAILAPSVFTNVEPTMEVARPSRPAPILALLRAGSDVEARALTGDRTP
jgi:hypothetical protein